MGPKVPCQANERHQKRKLQKQRNLKQLRKTLLPNQQEEDLLLEEKPQLVKKNLLLLLLLEFNLVVKQSLRPLLGPVLVLQLQKVKQLPKEKRRLTFLLLELNQNEKLNLSLLLVQNLQRPRKLPQNVEARKLLLLLVLNQNEKQNHLEFNLVVELLEENLLLSELLQHQNHQLVVEARRTNPTNEWPKKLHNSSNELNNARGRIIDLD